MERLVMQPASSSYPSIGTTYKRAGYTIEYSPALTRTDRNYYGSETLIPSGQRMSTAAEELAIQLGLEKVGKDPRKEAVFNDLFGRKDCTWDAWQWTDTGLRVPKGWDPTKYETDSKDRKYWAREVLIGDKVAGEILVPEGNGRVVVEWDEVFGIPRATMDINWPHSHYTTHFWFKAKPSEGKVSGYQDVAVGRRNGWRRDEVERCLAVDANFARSDAVLGAGFRPVLHIHESMRED